MNLNKLKAFLDEKVALYQRSDFIDNDPISIPHLFTDKPNQEIMGFIAATLAWGQRITIIRNCRKLIDLMDGDPHAFLLGHEDSDLRRFEGFVHRTFNDTDLLYFITFLSQYYRQHLSIEELFLHPDIQKVGHVGPGLRAFHERFFELEFAPHRTRKHVATPNRNSACKRLNMFLRWMVRPAEGKVDFGIWNSIQPHQLICPLDTHVHRVSLGLGLIKRNQADWKAALELTSKLREFDPADPVKYDYALFALGVEERF